MACKIHGLTNCPLPSCVQQQNVLCDVHFMENCHLCPIIATPPKSASPQVVPAAPSQVHPVISDPHANEVLSAAEAYAQARQDVATIAENVQHLQQNLQFAREKLAEAKKAQAVAKKKLAELARGDTTEAK